MLPSQNHQENTWELPGATPWGPGQPQPKAYGPRCTPKRAKPLSQQHEGVVSVTSRVTAWVPSWNTDRFRSAWVVPVWPNHL